METHHSVSFWSMIATYCIANAGHLVFFLFVFLRSPKISGALMISRKLKNQFVNANRQILVSTMSGAVYFFFLDIVIAIN